MTGINTGHDSQMTTGQKTVNGTIQAGLTTTY